MAPCGFTMAFNVLQESHAHRTALIHTKYLLSFFKAAESDNETTYAVSSAHDITVCEDVTFLKCSTQRICFTFADQTPSLRAESGTSSYGYFCFLVGGHFV